jgi:hypothetical protein
MSPWGTINDLELITLEADEDQEITPIWHGVPDHGDFENEIDAVNELIKIFTEALNCDVTNEEESEAYGEKFNGMFKQEIRTDLPALWTHAASIAIDELVQVEIAESNSGFPVYAQAFVRGAGIGNILKAALIAKNM